jgi:hypothetical protein
MSQQSTLEFHALLVALMLLTVFCPCRISTSLKITLLYFRPDLITFITSCTTLTFIYRTFSIYYELSLTFLTNKREQETHFLYFCFQDPYCIANAHIFLSEFYLLSYNHLLPLYFISSICPLLLLLLSLPPMSPTLL